MGTCGYEHELSLLHKAAISSPTPTWPQSLLPRPTVALTTTVTIKISMSGASCVSRTGWDLDVSSVQRDSLTTPGDKQHAPLYAGFLGEAASAEGH